MAIINKPEKIYLNTGIDEINEELNFEDLEASEEVTWCSDRQFKYDLPYYSKELMFEFAEWVGSYDGQFKEGLWFDFSDTLTDKTTEQLFKEFLKNREE